MPERDMLSPGVMGMGAGGLRKFFRRRRRCRRRPAAPLDWRRRWIGCAAGLAAPLDWLRRWIGGAAEWVRPNHGHVSSNVAFLWRGMYFMAGIN